MPSFSSNQRCSPSIHDVKMIDPEYRFFAGTGGLLAAGPYTWHIVDFDQRRFFSVTYITPTPIQDFEEREKTEGICVAELKKHVDHLDKSVYGFSFSEPDGPITEYTDLANDSTSYVNYPLLSDLKISYPIKTLHLGNLTELDRLGPEVDMVSYPEAPAVAAGDGKAKSTTAVFKYWLVFNGWQRTWRELHLWSSLPRDHPNIVPFDSVVLDSVSGGIVGFTSIFIPGGTLEDTATTRTFRLQWLHQLVKVVDELNYDYGIMHQDIAPRNLLIHGDDMQLFDFNISAMVGEDCWPGRDDGKGVVLTVHEIITRDEHYRNVQPDEIDAEAVMDQEWVKHPDVKLDSDVQDFKGVLVKWLAERKGRDLTPQPTWIKWPTADPEYPPTLSPAFGPRGEITGTKMEACPAQTRKHMVKIGKSFWDWERPASYNLQGSLEEHRAQVRDHESTE